MAERILCPEKFTYSAATGPFTPASSPTDIFEIRGASGRKIQVLSVVISATQTTGGSPRVVLAKRSTANSGGTTVASTKVPHTSKLVASTATVQHYTANPTTGTLVGNIYSGKQYIPAATEIIQPMVEYNLDLIYGTPVMLHDATESLVVNLAGVTLTGGSVDITVTWIEELTVPVGTT